MISRDRLASLTVNLRIDPRYKGIMKKEPYTPVPGMILEMASPGFWHVRFKLIRPATPSDLVHETVQLAARNSPGIFWIVESDRLPGQELPLACGFSNIADCREAFRVAGEPST
jgi:hypothetical protein